MFHKICSELAALPHIAELAEAVYSPTRTPRPLLRVAPMMRAARVPTIAALVHHVQTTLDRAQPPITVVLYVVDSAEMATRAAEDLSQWLSPEQVLLYPVPDRLSYEYGLPEPTMMSQRLRVLQWLTAPRHTLAVVVTSCCGLLHPTFSPKEFQEATTSLRIGDHSPPDTLVRQWLDGGYRMKSVVEDVGEMARRGGIVDIWPAAFALPLRIEWFGDEIDSLRSFDPQTQRSDQRLQRIAVGPAFEIPCGKRDQVIEQIKAITVRHLRPEAREEWESSLERLISGGRFEGWARFAPFFSQQSGRCASLLDYLPTESIVVLGEEELLSQAAAAWHEQAEEQRRVLIDSGELPAEMPRPYNLWEEVWDDTLCIRSIIDLSNNEGTLAPPAFAPTNLFGGQIRRFVQQVVHHLSQDERVVVVSSQVARFQELIEEHATSHSLSTNGFLPIHTTLSEGWRLPDLSLTLYTDTEIFGWRQRRSLAEIQRRNKQRNERGRGVFLQGLKPGEYVVHIEYGIALYEGLIHRSVAGVEREYLSLRYANNERLYVPVDQTDRVSRYVGSGDAKPRLTRLGTQEWERAKRKVRTAVEDLANELLALYARRKLLPGFAFSPDNEWQHDMEDAFPFVETQDQVRALIDVKVDMESPHPMDRLICGDVGFGKTEVALRAAFKAVQDGKQVAVLVPTTILAQQHYDTFRQRLESFPVRVEMLSRFRSPSQQQVIVQQLFRGEVDILVGTHRLLSRDVLFKDLGLLIIDEEQRFGVRHKERLKQMRTEVDVLTLTATPIPRTLHMALSGIRDMSVIDTPPDDRVPIKTYVVPYSKTLVRDVIRRELSRDGQVYVVHNRVQTIYAMADRLQQIVPEARIGVGHGQLDEDELEQVMVDFFNGTYDVLVCTTIIENGLDIPNVNTIIVDDAPHYGLSQLYQLRGRVGRSSRRAYAYFLYRPGHHMTVEASQRLQAIQEATELGAGFRIAMRDLEIRGAGNLLGDEQSGYIAAVGLDLYSRLLEQAVNHIREQQMLINQPATTATSKPKKPRIDEKVLVSPLITLSLPISAYLPYEYIPDEQVRLHVYQRMLQAQQVDDVALLRRELRDRFGELPAEVGDLLTWLRIKVLAVNAGVTSITTTDEDIVVRLPDKPGVRERLQRRFGQDHTISISPQLVRLDRAKLEEQWVEKVISVLEVLG